MLITSILYMATKGKLFKRFYHDFLEWHLPIENQTFNGCSYCSYCKICGKEIIQDSQGNWYSIKDFIEKGK